MDVSIAQIVEQKTESLLKEIAEIQTMLAAGEIPEPVAQTWLKMTVKSHIEGTASSTRIAIQNAIVSLS